MAEVIAGTEMLLAVTPLPVVSAMTPTAFAPAAQSSAAAKLYVVPPVELVPFLLTIGLSAALSVALSVSVKLVPDVISTLDVSVSV